MQICITEQSSSIISGQNLLQNLRDSLMKEKYMEKLILF